MLLTFLLVFFSLQTFNYETLTDILLLQCFYLRWQHSSRLYPDATSKIMGRLRINDMQKKSGTPDEDIRRQRRDSYRRRQYRKKSTIIQWVQWSMMIK